MSATGDRVPQDESPKARTRKAMSAPELMQVRAAAKQLGVHENTLRRWEEAGLIKAVRLPSGTRRFRAVDVERLRREIYEPGSHARAAESALRDATTAVESSG